MRVTVAVSTLTLLWSVIVGNQARAVTVQSGTVQSAVAAEPPQTPMQMLTRATMATALRLAVVLKYRDEPQLRQLEVAQSDPASPLFGHWLTADQFRNTFAPSPADYAFSISALRAAGFQIVATYPNRTVIDIVGPAPIVERYFRTQINVVRQNAAIRYANVLPAFIPPALQRTVYGIIGFDDLRMFKTDNEFGKHGKSLVPYAALGPPVFGPDVGYGPYAFASAYDFPVQHQIPGAKAGVTYDGSGRSAAVVIDSDYNDSDLSRFLSYFHITRTGPATTRVLVDGGPSPAVNGDSIETTLDVETIVSQAPGVALYVYEPPQLSYVDIIDTYNHVTSDDLVDVVNSSFGGCETETLPSFFPQLSNYIADQGAVEGTVFSASTGDSGAFECLGPRNGAIRGVATPASGTDFIAAGGTTLFETSSGKYRTEWGWSGSGGGVSAIFKLPDYQQGVGHVISSGRNLPDIAFDADPDSGASFYYQGAWQGPIGGTSLASPLFTALVAQTDEVNEARVGGIHARLYTLFKRYGYTGPYGKIFRDEIQGNNGLFNALPGYDHVTGIGSIDGWDFAQLVK